MIRRLLIIVSVVLALIVTSLLLPTQRVTIKAIGTLSIGQQAAYASPDWLSGWAYRKSHIINSATGAGTNYQVKVTVYYGSGTDSGENVYLSSKCRTDFGDVRFTDDDQTTPLDYWMQEKVDGNYAIFWVEVADDLGTANRTIYIYYCKSDATTTSNGANTFVFFDDFNRANKADITIEDTYSQTGGGTWSIEDNKLKNIGAAGDPNKLLFYSLGTVSYSVVMKAKINVTTFGGSDLARMGLSCCMESNGQGYCSLLHQTQSRLDLLNDLRSWGTSFTQSWSLNTWYYLEFLVIDPSTRNGKTRLWKVGDSVPSWRDGNFGSGVARTWGYLGFGGSRQADVTYFDDIYVRKYVDPEPSHGTWGSEERFPLDISNAPLEGKDFGTVFKNSSYWSHGSIPPTTFPLYDDECFFTVTNNSSAPVNISIRATNFSGGDGWIIDSSPGVNIVTLKAGKSGDVAESNMVILTTSDQSFITGLAQSTSKKWEIKLETGTFTDAVQKTSTITLTATYP